MATVPGKGKPIQDVPPPGGYGRVVWDRRVPSIRGPPGYVIWGLVIGATAFGHYQAWHAKKENTWFNMKQRRFREAILAYTDAIDCQQEALLRKMEVMREAEIMKNVEGWKVDESVYHTRKYVPPVRG